MRYAAVRLIHAPLVSLAARQWFTDTTNAYRAYSREYLTHPEVRPLRDVFQGYELLAYLSIRATQLGLRACEVPVTRAYPATGKMPTKITGFKGNSDLLKILLAAMAGQVQPVTSRQGRRGAKGKQPFVFPDQPPYPDGTATGCSASDPKGPRSGKDLA